MLSCNRLLCLSNKKYRWVCVNALARRRAEYETYMWLPARCTLQSSCDENENLTLNQKTIHLYWPELNGNRECMTIQTMRNFPWSEINTNGGMSEISVLDPHPMQVGLTSVVSTNEHPSPFNKQLPVLRVSTFIHEGRRLRRPTCLKIPGKDSVLRLFAGEWRKAYAIAELNGPLEVKGWPVDSILPFWSSWG